MTMDVIKDLMNEEVYVELNSNRRYKGKLVFVDDLFCKILQHNGNNAIFPKSEIKFIQEEK